MIRGTYVIKFLYFEYAKIKELEIMDNILGWIVIIIAGGFSLILCLYMVLSLFVVAGYKFYRKFRYGISLFD